MSARADRDPAAGDRAVGARRDASRDAWVLLRGLTRERAHWGGFVDALAARVPGVPVLAPDLPGTGTRRDRPSPVSIAAIADDVRAQLREAGHPPPYRVLALSLGAMVAIDWMRGHPEELVEVTLVNTSVRPFSPPWRRLRPGAWPAVLRAATRADDEALERTALELTSRLVVGESARAAVARWVGIRRERPVARGDALRQLWAAARFAAPRRAPAVPVRVLASARDALVHPSCSRALAAAWRAPIDVHPAAGHDLPLDDPDWLLVRMLGDAAVTRP